MLRRPRLAAPPQPAADYYSSKFNAYYSLMHAGGYYYIWGAQDWCDDLTTVAGKSVGRGQMVLVYYTSNEEQSEVENAIFKSQAPSLSNRRGWVGTGCSRWLCPRRVPGRWLTAVACPCRRTWLRPTMDLQLCMLLHSPWPDVCLAGIGWA